MESIKLHINRLGRIVESDVEITRMVIFSGESSLGKSYMAMLCHYFFEVLLNSRRLSKFFNEHGMDYNRDLLKNSGVACSFEKSLLEKWMAKDAIDYISDLLGHSIDGDIDVALPDAIPDKIDINYEEQVTGLVHDLETYVLLMTGHLKYMVKDSDSFDESPFAYILRYELIDRIFGDYKNLRSTFVLPPSRGPVLTEDVKPRTGMYREFKDKVQGLDRSTKEKPQVSTELIRQIRGVMEGEVSRKETGYVFQTMGVEIPVSAAASSIRELAPLEMIVEKTDVSRDCILIEEPEAHLHPEKQRGVADIIGYMYVLGACLQITTHSDYFISRINELMLLGRLKEQKSQKVFQMALKDTMTDGALALDCTEIKAYLLKRTGDNHSVVIEQDLTHGVPFTSFSVAVNDNLRNGDKLEELLYDE
jgi:hypothetical protein